MERDLSHAVGANVGPANSCPSDFEHHLCSCARALGCEAAWYGNGGGAAHARHAHCLYARSSAPIRGGLRLLSRAKLRRYRHDVYQTTKLCRTRQFLSLALWTDNGPFVVVVSQSYYMFNMSGVSAIYLEQGFDQFFKPGAASILFN